MDAPLVRYARTDDGVSVAYWLLGDGPPLVQLPALPHSHIQVEWEIPEWRRGYEFAAESRTVVRYDGRGTGLSQRDVEAFSLETMLADLDAVVSELKADRVALLGVINSCPIAIAYAARFPERISDLILWCPVVDGAVHRDNPMLTAARKVMETDWETFSEVVAHGLVGWSESDAARRFAELVRAGIDQPTALMLVPSLHELNVWDRLPQVRCRTLVLHRPDLPLLPPGTAERVAATIPDAQLAMFSGSSSAPYVGDWRSIVRTIAEFLGAPTRVTRGAPARRALRLLTMSTDALSPREREVAELVARGLTNRQIARELVLAEKTVENHVSRILVKLDLRSRAQLAAYAVEHGIAGRSA